MSGIAQQEKLRKIIVRAREFTRLSRTEFSIKSGISGPFVSQIESGRNKVTLNTLNVYSRISGIPVSTFLIFAEGVDSDKYEDIIQKFGEFNEFADKTDQAKGEKA